MAIRNTLAWIGFALTAGAVIGATAPVAGTREFLYVDGAVSDCRFRPWNMKWEEQSGGGKRSGKCLWFNLDWKAHPWAGVTFERTSGPGIEVDKTWIDRGFVRFLVNIGVDSYGFPGGGVRFQMRPLFAGSRYQALHGQFIDRGRGTDEDLETWQEVLVPLSYWTNLKPGAVITGVSIQCRGRPTRTFGLDEVGFVCFSKEPAWLAERLEEKVAQPTVRWPSYEHLPSLLRADRHPPRVVDGRFVWPDGRRVFVLNPYCREDPRLDLWGTIEAGKCAPDHRLYDPKVHGWIYQELPTAHALCRLGFNSFSATMPPQPWWDMVGYKRKDGAADAARLPGFYARVKLPFYVDTVAWPWTIGAPNSPKTTRLPSDAFTLGRNHWTPYRIIGKGRDAWRRMWRLYARRYRDAGVPVLMFELMNEPAYVGMSDDHRREFGQWLRRRYGTLDTLNWTWGSTFSTWDQAAEFSGEPELRKVVGRALDYDEYLAQRFAELVALGVKAVAELLPDTLTGVQTMGGFALRPRDAVWKHLFTPYETVVLTPTGGGRWTPSGTARRRPKTPVDCPMARAPFEDDLLRALAGPKMIYDNETYLRGQTAVEVRNRLWEQVIAGLDGLTVFSWSKRGWIWWHDRAAVLTEADKFPYTDLNPFARRTEALRGIHDFAAEIQPVADRILRKPWGPRPAIGLLYGWAHARWMSFNPELPDKTGDYYAALKYTHWNLSVLPSHQAIRDALGGYAVIVAPGLTHIDRELIPRLQSFVRKGGVLIVGEQALDRDLYDHPIDSAWLGVSVGDAAGEPAAGLTQFPSAIEEQLPGAIRRIPGVRRVTLGAQTEAVLRDDRGRVVLTRHRAGKGFVYFQAADVVGYPLAKVLWTALADAAVARGLGGIPNEWRLADVRDSKTGWIATNVLLSRRSYRDNHALLFMNLDEYDKHIQVAVTGLDGVWRTDNGLTGQPVPGPSGTKWLGKDIAAGVPIDISAGGPALFLLSKVPPAPGPGRQ